MAGEADRLIDKDAALTSFRPKKASSARPGTLIE